MKHGEDSSQPAHLAGKAAARKTAACTAPAAATRRSAAQWPKCPPRSAAVQRGKRRRPPYRRRWRQRPCRPLPRRRAAVRAAPSPQENPCGGLQFEPCSVATVMRQTAAMACCAAQWGITDASYRAKTAAGAANSSMRRLSTAVPHLWRCMAAVTTGSVSANKAQCSVCKENPCLTCAGAWQLRTGNGKQNAKPPPCGGGGGGGE